MLAPAAGPYSKARKHPEFFEEFPTSANWSRFPILTSAFIELLNRLR